MDGLGVFAQQLYGFGRPGDVFLGISTSGNSKNVLNATVVARVEGIRVIGLTGAKGGKLAEVADIAIKAPETETYKVQECHLPIYHCLCLMLEDQFFGDREMESNKNYYKIGGYNRRKVVFYFDEYLQANNKPTSAPRSERIEGAA